jgi:hypothetical protein
MVGGIYVKDTTLKILDAARKRVDRCKASSSGRHACSRNKKGVVLWRSEGKNWNGILEI